MMLRRLILPEMRNALRMLESDLQEIRHTSPFETVYRDITTGSRSIPANVLETNKAFHIEAEVPGAAREDINIELTDERTLAIHGNIKAKKPIATEKTKDKESDIKVWAEERSTGSFHRVFQFPTRLSQDGIKADIKDGVLTLEVSKSTENGSKKIPIDWK
jgi:HSP20 family molecular chaperone IbpA